MSLCLTCNAHAAGLLPSCGSCDWCHSLSSGKQHLAWLCWASLCLSPTMPVLLCCWAAVLCGSCNWCSNLVVVDLQSSTGAPSPWEAHLAQLMPAAQVVKFLSVGDLAWHVDRTPGPVPRVDLLKVRD